MTSTAPDSVESSRAERGKKPLTRLEIAVNGEEVTVDDERVTFERVVAIAYPVPPGPDTAYTVTYRGAKGRQHEGELAEGESVTVKKKGTAFDVTPTGKS